jgi:hypothetical protein
MNLAWRTGQADFEISPDFHRYSSFITQSLLVLSLISLHPALNSFIFTSE